MGYRNSAIFLALLAVTAAAQNSRGTISGSVTDDDGKAVGGAQIHAKSEAGAEWNATASKSGGYSLTNVPAGTYEIMISFPGLQPFQKQNVKVAAGETARVDGRLHDQLSLGSLGEDRTFFANAMEPHDAPTGPIPRTSDGKPDFSGMWHPLRLADPGKPEMLPSAEALFKERIANNLKDFPMSRCLPTGMTIEGTFGIFRIMQNQTVVAFLFEEDLPRQIYLDGRKHPEEPLTPFIGHSVGKWDGDTLVVDTVGFNDKTWLDILARPHTDQMHTVERMRRKDLGHLEVEITIDDPGAYKKQWVMKRAAELAPANEEVAQYICTENNRDVPHLVGK